MGQVGGRPVACEAVPAMPVSSVSERAKADFAAGEAWRARDRLNGAFANDRSNAEIVELLGEAYYRMGDLPAAGRWWYFSELDDEAHARARAAFERRYGRRADQIRGHLPRVGKEFPLHADVRARLDAVDWSHDRGGRPADGADGAPHTLAQKFGCAVAAAIGLVATVGIWLVGLLWLASELL